MTIALFALGSAIRYRKDRIKKIDGSYDYYITLWALARNPSVDKILVLSRSDYDKATLDQIVELDPYNKIIDVYHEHRDILRVTGSMDPQIRQMEVVSRLNRVMEQFYPSIDFGIGFNTQAFDTRYVIPGLTRITRPPYSYNRVFETALNYVSPLVHYLNISGLPWFMVSIDYRYLKIPMNNVHTVNLPREIISQKEQDVPWNTLDSYSKDSPISSKIVKASASGFEIMGVIGQTITSPNRERNNRFSVLVTQNSQGFNPNDLRYRILKEWIIEHDHTGQSSIYGKWQEEYTRGISQFRGYLEKLSEVDDLFRNTKYTLVMPAKGGYVTFKHLEMLVHGTVPFCHPNYDENFTFVPKDHILRVSSPEEMYEKMDYLDLHDNERISLIHELQRRCLDGIQDGSAFAKVINGSIERTSLGQQFLLSQERINIGSGRFTVPLF